MLNSLALYQKVSKKLQILVKAHMCPQASSLGGGHFGYLEKEDPRFWIQAISITNNTRFDFKLGT
jgi:hypothetical protein